MRAARLRVILGLSLALMASACTYRGGDMGDPLTRKLHWFSFVEGEDIRAACAAGTPDRYRVVYNGVYDEQLRIYELDSVRRVLGVKVTGGGNVAALRGDDLLAPWRAAEARVPLDQAAYDGLVARFAESGMFAPPPQGLRLPSHSYYWIAASCRDGKYALTAWAYPSAAFDAVTFASALSAQDPTGIAVAQPHPLPLDPLREAKLRRGEVVDFTLQLGRNGLLK